ncbi:PGA52-like protein [Phlyctema vagabunda]|uniref:PGA52-like protein n=1 Tax=Phlyctema vagabunda TaxID=108571 RepID=A0ABR4PFR4_9HELO
MQASSAEPVTQPSVSSPETAPTSAPAVSMVAHAPQTASPETASQGTDDYMRIGYYDSGSQVLDNLVFLGNHGGQGSGVFDMVYGASLSYVNSAGTGGSEGPEVLQDGLLPSGNEVAIMLGQECEDDDCGFVRPDSVAYHGFDGADKVFLFEFSMPHDGDPENSGDMPAIWILNADIPRVQQYGAAGCSCWSSGCGEFDIVETLFPGSKYLKSTVHTNTPAGDSDYILRPTDKTIKLAVVFNSSNSTAHIRVLENDISFSSSLSMSEIENLTSSPGGETSHFAIVT